MKTNLRKNEAIEGILIALITILVIVALVVLSKIEYGAEPKPQMIDSMIENSNSFTSTHVKLN